MTRSERALRKNAEPGYELRPQYRQHRQQGRQPDDGARLGFGPPALIDQVDDGGGRSGQQLS
jgi:hypothetical protein